MVVSSRGGFTGGVLARGRFGLEMGNLGIPYPRTCLSGRTQEAMALLESVPRV